MKLLRCIPKPYFEANYGQLPSNVRFKLKANDYITYLTKDKLIVSLPSKYKNTRNVFYMKLENINHNVYIEGEDKNTGIVNYLIGNDESKWINNIPTYSKVKYEKVYEKIDLYYYINDENLEYDFVLARGANPRDICISFEGVDNIEINDDKNIVLAIGDVKALLLKPNVYQIIDDIKINIECEYILDENRCISFFINQYEAEYELVLDPVLKLEYSTYIGGTNCDYGMDIVVDSDGCAYITGHTEGRFPTTVGQVSFGGGYMDAFVTKLNPDGNGIIYSTYLGGSGGDFSKAIAIDSLGCAYVTGLTYSSDFPITDAYQITYEGNGDAFVSKLNPLGQMLLYSTYLGGNTFNVGNSIAVDNEGYAYITGQTENNYPITSNAYQIDYGGGKTDAFVSKLGINGEKLIYSTYLGSSGKDCGNSIAVDKYGYAYITGYAGENYPTTKGASQSEYGGGDSDVFVTKVNMDGSSLVYSTYIGGNATDCGDSIAIDNLGNAYVVGFTKGSYPLVNSNKSTFSGKRDIIVSKLNSDGTTLLYSTYLGDSNTEHGYDIAVDLEGCAYFTGYVFGDIFLCKLDKNGSIEMDYTSLRDGNDDYGRGIALDNKGCVYITGYAHAGYPTTSGAYQTSCKGGHDVIVSKISLFDFDLSMDYKPSKVKLLDTITTKLTFKNLSPTNVDINIKYNSLDSSVAFIQDSLSIQKTNQSYSKIPEKIYLSNIPPQKTVEIELGLIYISEKFPEKISISATCEVYENKVDKTVLIDTQTQTLLINTSIGPNYIPGCNYNLYNLEIDGKLQMTDSDIPIIYYKSGTSYIYIEPREYSYVYKILANQNYITEHKISKFTI